MLRRGYNTASFFYHFVCATRYPCEHDTDCVSSSNQGHYNNEERNNTKVIMVDNHQNNFVNTT